MKRFVRKTQLLGLIAIAATVLSSTLAACSALKQADSQAQADSPTATTAGSSSMDHGSVDAMGVMNMALGPADAEFDLRFLDAMTPHHEGAVVMAKEAQQKAKHPEIKKLADGIITAQKKEIAEMRQWRQAWYQKASKEPIAYNAQMGHPMPMTQDQMKDMMMSVDLGAADARFDLRFLNAMIPHHEGAVTMAQDALKKSKRPEIQTLAKNIIASQKAEINEMEQWRKAWYNQ